MSLCIMSYCCYTFCPLFDLFFNFLFFWDGSINFTSCSLSWIGFWKLWNCGPAPFCILCICWSIWCRTMEEKKWGGVLSSTKIPFRLSKLFSYCFGSKTFHKFIRLLSKCDPRPPTSTSCCKVHLGHSNSGSGLYVLVQQEISAMKRDIWNSLPL